MERKTFSYRTVGGQKKVKDFTLLQPEIHFIDRTEVHSHRKHASDAISAGLTF